MKLRKATIDDCDNLLEWRNDPETRAQSINSDLVEKKAHKKWLKESLQNEDRVLLIAETDQIGMPVGTCRIDYVSNNHADLSWTIAPRFRKRGFATQMLKLLFKRPELKGVTCMATVKKNNEASIRLAEKMGMRRQAQEGSDLFLFKADSA